MLGQEAAEDAGGHAEALALELGQGGLVFEAERLPLLVAHGLDLEEVHGLGDVHDADLADPPGHELLLAEALAGGLGDEEAHFQVFGDALNTAGHVHGIAQGSILEFVT